MVFGRKKDPVEESRKFRGRLDSWLEEVEERRSRYGKAMSYDTIVGVGCYALLDHYRKADYQFEEVWQRRHGGLETILNDVRQTYPGDYYRAYGEWKEGNPMASVAGLISVLAYDFLASRLQGAYTGLDITSATDELRDRIKKKKSITDFMGVPEMRKVNATMMQFFENPGPIPNYGESETAGPLTATQMQWWLRPDDHSMTPQELVDIGRQHEAAGGLSVAESFYNEAEEEILGNLLKNPMGRGPILAEAAQVKEKKDKVHETRTSPNPPPKEATSGKSQRINFGSLVVEQKPNVRFEDIVGNEKAKNALRKAMIIPFEKPEMFPLGFPASILLFGPPGCGKTYLTAAAAREIPDSVYVEVDAAELLSRYLGEAEKNVKDLFGEAKRRASSGTPVIICMDELDAIVRKDMIQESGDLVRNQIQKEMDGVLDKGKSQPRVYLIGTTNKPWMLNEAMIRRFPERIFVDLPSPEDRKALFELYLGKLAPSYEPEVGIDYAALAAKSDGYSGDDIKNILKDVQYIMFDRLKAEGKLESSPPYTVTMQDLEKALKGRHPSGKGEELEKQRQWARDHGTG